MASAFLTSKNKQQSPTVNTGYQTKNLVTLRYIAILLLFVNSIGNYFVNLPYSFLITSCSCIFLIASMYINVKKYFTLTRLLSLLLLSVVVIGLSYAEGLASGDYLYLFCFIIGAIFIYDTYKIKLLLIDLTVILLSLIVIFTFLPMHSTLQRIDASAERGMFAINVFTCAFITCLLAYLLIKRNYEKSKDLIDKQQFLNTVYNTSSDAVFIAESNTGIITDCNDNCISMFASASKEFLIAREINSFFADTSAENFNKYFNLKEQWKGELDCVTINGIEFPVYATIIPFHYRNALYNKISIIDISDIKRTQLALTDAKEKAEDAVAAKSRFLSNMSHELRTPLNGIIGTANLLVHESAPEEQHKNINLLKYSSEHMLNLINDILDFSKFEAGKMELEKKAFNIKQSIQHVAGIFAGQFHKKKVRFNIICDEQLDRQFVGDETRLHQVLVNLIGNALKFTDKGSVDVEVKQINCSSTKAAIYFAVTDSGTGIHAGKKEIIFESFTQADTSTNRKFGGTGLGLAISKKIVEACNGQLQVKSDYGKGSCFYFTIDLDISNKPATYINDANIGNLQPLDELRVLVAEDNPVNMMIARKFLKLWKIEPDEAKNGEEAFEKYNANQYDVLLIDLDMPIMDGFDLIKKIRINNPEVPAIAFTAAVYDHMQSDLINKGFTDYIQKPFRPQDLHRKLALHAVNAARA
jgi:signal transduction histidine kinase/CheY-like chemotaxis protein